MANGKMYLGSTLISDPNAGGGGSLTLTGQKEMSAIYNESITANDLVGIGNGIKLNDPSLLPINAVGTEGGVAWDSTGTYLALACQSSSPYLALYRKDGDTFTKLSNPDVLATNNSMSVSWYSNYLAITTQSSPFVIIYKRTGDSFAKLANPDVLPAGLAHGCKFSPNGDYLVVSHATNPFFTIYKRSGDSFTKLANPGSLPPNTGFSVSWSGDMNYVAIGHSTSPYVSIYSRSGDTFTKMSNVDIAPAGTGYQVVLNYDGSILIMGIAASPFLQFYKRTGSTWNKYSGASILPNQQNNGICLSSDDNYLVCSNTTFAPYLFLYVRNGDNFKKLPYLLNLWSSGQVNSVGFSPDMNYLVVGVSTTPFVHIYKNPLSAYASKCNLLNNIVSGSFTMSKGALGYAKESGNTGEAHNVVALFKDIE